MDGYITLGGAELMLALSTANETFRQMPDEFIEHIGNASHHGLLLVTVRVDEENRIEVSFAIDASKVPLKKGTERPTEDIKLFSVSTRLDAKETELFVEALKAKCEQACGFAAGFQDDEN